MESLLKVMKKMSMGRRESRWAAVGRVKGDVLR